MLDQSQIGRILTGDAEALQGGPPVKAMLIQNTNPMTVAPEQALVRQGFAREDLFMAVHEQFMTETAADGGHRAAGDDVHGARRSLLRRRPSAHFGRRQADRPARRMPLQP